MKLGAKCKDKVSGFVGVAVARHTYLNGCDRITIQPKIDKSGQLPEPQTFDEPQLEILEQVLVEGDRTVGGPEKFSDNRSY